MKVFVALLCFLGGALALGEEHCSWGPSYWCSSLKTAKSCGAIPHCTQTVWSTSVAYKQDNTDICQFCENFLQDAITFLTEKGNVDEVKRYLDAACAIIPVSALADQCKDAVDNDLDEIINLVKNLNPKATCAAIGLCSGFKDNVPHPGVKAEQDLHHVTLKKSNPLHVSLSKPDLKGDVCADCKTLVNDLKAEITSKTEQAEVEQMLKDRLCKNLGALQSECNDLVTEFVPQLLQLLSQQMDADLVCGSMGFCPASDPLLLVKMKLKESPLYKAAQVSGEEECSFCKTVLAELQDLDRNKATQQEIESFIKAEICNNLGAMKDVCDQSVEEYGQLLFELLANELDPATRCASLGFCTAPSLQMTTITRLATPVKKEPVHKDVDESAECILCQYVMSTVDGLLKQNATKFEIEAALEKVCSLLPDTLKLECKNFVDFYGDVIIDLLAQELSPEMVCQTIGICAKKVEKQVGGAEACTLCMTVVEYVKSALADNATEGEILKYLDEVCGYLPTSLQPTCDTFVKQYGPMIAQLLSQEISPSEVCTQIGLCTNEKATPPVAPIVKESTECEVCEVIVQYIDSLLQENATEAEIEKLLNKVCNFLPTSLEDQCEGFLKEYGKLLVQLLVQEMTPQQICQQLHLCEKMVKTPLLGVKECTFGPAFWCRNIENAKKCKAVEHCKNHVWKN